MSNIVSDQDLQLLNNSIEGLNRLLDANRKLEPLLRDDKIQKLARQTQAVVRECIQLLSDLCRQIVEVPS
jgi:O-succinylbenzoate synthase